MNAFRKVYVKIWKENKENCFYAMKDIFELNALIRRGYNWVIVR